MTISSNDVLLEDACKVYGKNTNEIFKPFKPISFHLREGELLNIIGPNGSGKTTLLRAIAGLTTFEEGNLTQNHKVNFLSSNESQMFDQLTGEENLKYFLGLRANKINLNAIYERWNIVPAFEKALETKYTLCSKGMKRILDLCLVFEDKGTLVLLDEPFHGIDDENKKSIIGIVNKNFVNKTIIITSQVSEETFTRKSEILTIEGNQ